jgi:hypothetical protein
MVKVVSCSVQWSVRGEELDRSGEAFELGAPDLLKFANVVVFTQQAHGPMVHQNLARLRMA